MVEDDAEQTTHEGAVAESSVSSGTLVRHPLNDLDRLRAELDDAVRIVQSGGNPSQDLLAPLLPYYTVAVELVKSRSNSLLARVLLRDDVRDVSRARDLVVETSVGTKVSLLYETGTIENETRERLIRAKNVRNDLVHEVDQRYTLATFESERDFERELDAALEAVHTLDEVYKRRHEL
ncbi:hypothetical protein [Salinirubrum litoreum]|uniref:Uncharacterized protein n=1 Tax=Salinirubrum litoreum TaxID=1126234 RepID=A0ABD5R899_9EURY|nr:hypothetical protein [Salinirubrum litoreum]